MGTVVFPRAGVKVHLDADARAGALADAYCKEMAGSPTTTGSRPKLPD